MKIQVTNGEMLASKYIAIKNFVSKLYKQLMKVKNREATQTKWKNVDVSLKNKHR